MSLTAEQKLVARKFIKLKIHESSAQQYEDLFTRIMSYAFKNFEPVKPQGRIGDKKCDGLIKSEGKYYQSYAPQEPDSKEDNAIKKLGADFAGLYKYWNDQVAPIKEFNFVLNDKYMGAYPTIQPIFAQIEKDHQGVTCRTFLAKDLEDIFINLEDDQIYDIIGTIPDPYTLEVDFSVMYEVVAFLLAKQTSYTLSKYPSDPNFNKKIVFNKLSDSMSSLLKVASWQEGNLMEFFRINSNFAKEELRLRFNNLYLEGKSLFANIQDEIERSDTIFLHILQHSYSDSEKRKQDAVLTLMAYYFGKCDIFEEPIENEQTSLF